MCFGVFLSAPMVTGDGLAHKHECKQRENIGLDAAEKHFEYV
jgi:hypothetical protein